MYINLKRILDILFALLLIPILFPIMIITSFAIKFDSEGPIFFKQTRSGKNGKEFKIIKFRSMTDTKENEITKVGKILRITSIDEIPQLFNIIKGEMSFIGPRPWVVDCYQYLSEKQKRRLDVLPGITGLAQVYDRKNLNICERINYDLYYINNISFKLDVQIIGLTIEQVLKHEDSNSKTNVEKEIEELKNQAELENNTIPIYLKQQNRKLLSQKRNLLSFVRTQKNIEISKSIVNFYESYEYEKNRLKKEKHLK